MRSATKIGGFFPAALRMLLLVVLLFSAPAIAAPTTSESLLTPNPDGTDLTESAVNDAVKRSIELIAIKKFDAATEILMERIGRSRQPNATLLAAVANVYLAQGKIKDAITFAEAAAQIRRDYDWPANILASAYIKAKQFRQAAANIKKLREIPSPVAAATLSGDWYREQGRRFKADPYYAEAVTLNPADKALADLRKWNLDEGVALAIGNEAYDEALAYLTKLEDSKFSYDAHGAKGRIYVAMGNRKRADDEYTKSWQKRGGKSEQERLFTFRMESARLAYAEADYAAAFELVSQAEKVKRAPEVDAMKADIFRQQSKYIQAERYYKKATPFANKNGYVHEARAWNFTLQGDSAAAENALLAAIAASPDDPRYLVALALHYKRQERIVEAMTTLAKARQLCNANRSNGGCPRFDEIYPLDFFDYSPAAGYGLDEYKIPVALAASLQLLSLPSSTESIVHGLTLQRIAPDNHAMALPVKMTKFTEFETRANVYSSYAPMFTVYYRNREAVSGDESVDSTLDKSLHQVSIESIIRRKTGHGLLLSARPFLRYTQVSGVESNNETLRGGAYSMGEYSGGLRLRGEPINSGMRLEGGAALGRSQRKDQDKSFGTQLFDVNFFAVAGSTLAFETSLYLFRSPQDPSGSDLQRLEMRVGAAYLFGGQSSLGIQVRDITYDDEFESEKLSTNVRVYQTNLRLWPAQDFGAEFEAARKDFRTYDAYDHMSYEAKVFFKPHWLSKRRLPGDNLSVPYTLPIEMYIGYSMNVFERGDIPENDRLESEDTLKGISYGIRLFW